MVDANIVGLGARVAEGHLDRLALCGLNFVAVGVVEGDVECSDHLGVRLLFSNSILNLRKLIACHRRSGEVPSLGEHVLVNAHGDDNAADRSSVGSFRHRGRLRLNYRLRLVNRLGLISRLFRRLNRGLLLGHVRRFALRLRRRLALGLFDNRGVVLGFDRRLLFGNNLVFSDRLFLDHDLRFDGGLLFDESHLLVAGGRFVDDGRFGDDRIRRLCECVLDALRGEHLQHEDEREDPCKRTARALVEPAELLTHDQHLSFGPRDDGKIDTAVPWSHIAPFKMVKELWRVLTAI